MFSFHALTHQREPNRVLRSRVLRYSLVVGIATLIGTSFVQASDRKHEHRNHRHAEQSAEVGPRPFFLVNDMDESALKDRLASCSKGPFYKTDFSIGHRGAPLQFPEHTEESYRAAAKMGAGIVECDVTFTKDRELVCRHSQCDLATTTNILETPLAAKCSKPFTPADPISGTKASAQCCTSDITLAEFKTLKGKMDASNSNAITAKEFLGGTADYRTDLYATRGTLMSHRESIELFRSLGVKMTPELKAPMVEMPFQGHYSVQQYAQQMLDEYRLAGIPARNVWPQSFSLDAVHYWIANEPRFARQAVYLDGRDGNTPPIDPRDPTSFDPTMQAIADSGINIIAPPITMLLDLDSDGKIVPSAYAIEARQAGLDIIAWSLERSGPLTNGGGYYYSSVSDAINNDGDMMTALHVLADGVGVIGVFSDWPATTTYYANCMNR